jgi:imidazolonepropionase-like amidohydrolase
LYKRRVILLLFAASALLPLAAPARQTVAVTHVTVIDGTGAKEKSDRTVLVTGERIVAVGKSRRVKLPEGARIVDGTGKSLIPGLWDMHVHGSCGTPAWAF